MKIQILSVSNVTALFIIHSTPFYSNAVCSMRKIKGTTFATSRRLNRGLSQGKPVSGKRCWCCHCRADGRHCRRRFVFLVVAFNDGYSDIVVQRYRQISSPSNKSDDTNDTGDLRDDRKNKNVSTFVKILKKVVGEKLVSAQIEQ